MINSSAITYSATYSLVGYPTSLADMGGANPCTASSTTACLLDENLAQGTKSGYSFVWTGDGATPSLAYTVTATPLVAGGSGQRMFCSDQSYIIRADPSGAGCSASSPALQ
jgi:hypothetical protein